MPILSSWRSRLAEVNVPEPPPPAAFAVPRSPAFHAGRTLYVTTAEEAKALAELAAQRPLACVGVDAEFQYDRPGVVVDRRQTAHDPTSIRPLLLSLSLAESRADEGRVLYNFVVDLRREAVLPALGDLFRLPVRFVGHFLRAELFCLLRLGLPEPRMLWDTWAHEKARSLGRHHKKYRVKAAPDEATEARAAEEAEQEAEQGCGLVATCHRYGVDYPLAADKERLQRSFLDHPVGRPFSDEQIRYAAADAVAVALLYPLQVRRAALSGILHHLETVEMPWVATNARMIWRGVRVDQDACRRAAEACTRHLAALRPQLEAHGIANVRSPRQLQAFFGPLGLLDLFKRDGRPCFDKELLEAFQGRHPAVPLIRAARKVYDLQKDKILTGVFVGADGRVHPDYRQLGTHSGRQTSRWPNVLGLGRLFRPLIVAEPGRGIGEVDWSQIEIGVAAAVYHDDRLVAMFNSGDVYSRMAQDFYHDRLSPEDRQAPGQEFKKKHAGLRSRMKTCTLGIIYGLTPHGLALYLDTSEAEAAALQARFMGLFPQLRRALSDAAASGGLRGYATTASGLRRHRVGKGRLSAWERNWMTNQPVQGSAAVVFKAAGNRLDRLYRRHDAWLIAPVHDAYVFEAPLASLADVAALTERVMCETVREYFPELDPRVEANITRPGCWNKDGHADSVERWMEDPTYSF